MSSPTAEHAYKPDFFGVDPGRRAANLQRWRAHSARVRLLRKVLPTLMVLLALVVGGWAGINTLLLRLTASNRTSNMAIRMVNPKFLGRDQGGRPFVLSAALAVRDSKTPQMIYLDRPSAVLGATPADQTAAVAGRGVYREDTRVLVLDDHVHLHSATNDFVSSHAVANTLTDDVDGDAHIDGSGAFGRISADGYAVRNNGEHVYFNGHVRAHIMQGGSASAPAESALKGPR
ncbi:MAG TPA: LPS export ABC transporter periplasmic protein LptC [Caulobacteraceae bacterium]|nr:LPS export ABC transporter periplasmic protein LptC [Caulobacteraceae bacterium]